MECRLRVLEIAVYRLVHLVQNARMEDTYSRSVRKALQTASRPDGALMGQLSTAYMNTALLFVFMAAAVEVSRLHEVPFRPFRAVMNAAFETTAPKTSD
jgi:hypothetical protein